MDERVRNGRDLDLPKDRKRKMNGTNGPSEGKDAILFLRVPSLVPFFICANFVFLALPSVYFLCVKREKRKSEGDGWVGRLLNTGSGFCLSFDDLIRELERLRVRIVWS